MTNPSAKQLHSLMSPLWERCPSLKVYQLWWGEPGEDDRGGIYKGEWIYRHRPTTPVIATALCGYKMVEWLAKRNATPWILIGMEGFSVGVCINHAMVNLGAPTLIEALALACSAVLDAAAEKETEG